MPLIKSVVTNYFTDVNHAKGKSHAYGKFILADFPKQLSGFYPFGAKRIPHTYHVKSEVGMVEGYPTPIVTELRHSVFLYLQDEHTHMCRIGSSIEKDDIHYNIYGFIMFHAVMRLLKNNPFDQSHSLSHNLNTMAQEFKRASHTTNRHILAVAYAQVLDVMHTFFRLTMFHLMQLDPSSLFNALNIIYTNGADACFYPIKIQPLEDNKTKQMLSDFTSEDDDGDDDEIEDSRVHITGVTLCMSLKNAVAMYHTQRIEREKNARAENNVPRSTANRGEITTAAELTPFIESFFGTKKSETAFADVVDPTTGYVLASKDYRHIRLPHPDMLAIKPVEWMKFAVYTCIYSQYKIKRCYYVTLPVLDKLIEEMKYIDGHDYPTNLSGSYTTAIIELMMEERIVVLYVKDGRKNIITAADFHKYVIGNSVTINEIRLMTPMAHQQEQEVYRVMQKITDNNEDVTESEFPPDSDIPMKNGTTLHPLQLRVIRNARKYTISAASGGGGTGKSTTMVTTAYYFRKHYGPHAIFLFCAPKNNTVNSIKKKIMTDSRNVGNVMTPTNCIFLTLKMIQCRYGYKSRDDEKLSPTCIFFDEAASASMPHFIGLFKGIVVKAVCKFVLLGDKAQLPPIEPGEVYRHMTDKMGPMLTVLEKSYRTGKMMLMHNMACVLEGRFDDIIDNDTSKEDSFQVIYSLVDSDWKTYGALKHTVDVLMKYIREVDPEKKKYRRIQIICPFNDLLKLLNYAMHVYYFGEDYPTSIDDWIMYAHPSALKTKRDIRYPDFNINERVRFIVNNKKDQNNFYTVGQLGTITGIADVSKSILKDIPNDAFHASRIRHTGERLDRSSKVRVVQVDNEYIVECKNSRELHSTMLHGSCITIDSSQGEQYDDVILVLPFSNMLCDRTRLYTSYSRAINKLTVITTKQQHRKMVNTVLQSTTSNLQDMFPVLFEQYEPSE